MSKVYDIGVLPGDGIGDEVVTAALRVLVARLQNCRGQLAGEISRCYRPLALRRLRRSAVELPTLEVAFPVVRLAGRLLHSRYLAKQQRRYSGKRKCKPHRKLRRS